MVKQIIIFIATLTFLFVGVPSTQALTDFDNDNDTDYHDLLSLVTNLHAPAFPAWLDQNQDNRLNLFDFNHFLSVLGQTVPATSPTLLDSVAGGGTNTTTISTPASVGGGNYIYLTSITTRPNVAVSSINGLGLTWTKLDTQCSYRNATGIEVWSAQGNGTTSMVNATFTGPVAAGSLVVSRFAGVSAATPIGTVISANTNGTESTTCHYVTDTSSDTNSYSLSLPAASPALIYNAVSIRSATHSPGFGFTQAGEIYSGTGGDTAGLVTQFKPVATTGTSTVNGSLSVPVDWAVVAVELKGLTSTSVTPTLHPTPTPTSVPPATIAFPGATGFGANTIGGRGGQVIFVTNLNDNNNPGSLRYALEVVSGPRLVLFKVAGVIRLSQNLIIRHPHVTLAGQTAPGNGIVLRGGGIIVSASDVIIRGMKIRPADDVAGETTTTRDALSVSGTYSSGEVKNIILDHNSLSWALDESATCWTSDVKFVTYSNNLMAEALNNSIHLEEGRVWPNFNAHSMGFMVGNAEGATDTAHNVSLYRNLLVSINDRNPRIVGYNVDIINNIFYNWGDGGAAFYRRTGGTYAIVANIYGNQWLRGPSSRCTGSCTPGIDDRPIRLDQTLNGASIYMDENFDDYFHRPGDTGSDWELAWCEPSTTNPPSICYQASTPPYTISTPRVSGIQAYTDVLNLAGANPTHRDVIDQGYIDDVVNRSGQLIDCVESCDIALGNIAYRQSNPWSIYTSAPAPADSDNDGIPNAWETSRGLNPNSGNDANLLAPSGYTWIEEYINSLIP